jgi:RHH-type rel operon transcriptional repressor/antitoxin RelB
MSVSLRLPDDLASRLKNLSQLTKRSKTFYMLEAIREHLDDLEDLYISEERMVLVRSGKSELIPLEEVMRQYDLDC